MSILKSTAISLGKKSQNLNPIDCGCVGVISNHGHALHYVLIAILVIQCILEAFP